MPTLKAVLDKRPLADGRHTVYIRITIDRKQRYISADTRTLKKDFNENGLYEKMNWIRNTVSDSASRNKKIKDTIDRINKIIEEDPDISLDTLMKLLTGKNTGDFIEYWYEFLEMKNKGVRDNTAGRYKGHVKTFCTFTNNKPVSFSDITEKLINDYEKWQLDRNSKETVKKSMAVLKRVVDYAYKKKKIRENPFDEYQKIKGGKSEKIPFTIEEMALFEKHRQDFPELTHYANTFLLQYYCAGARIRDIIQMRWHDIRDGRWFYSMNKTDRGMNILLSERAIAILNEYKGLDKEYVLPWIPAKISTWSKEYYKLTETITTMINRYLKVYIQKIGIDKPISTHIARHSFSENAKEISDGNLYASSKALGHSSLNMTMSNYLPKEDIKAVDALIIRMSNTDIDMNPEEVKSLQDLLTKIIRAGQREQLLQMIDRIV